MTTNIRLTSFKSFRHYGGREITTVVHTCKAELVREQDDHQKYICKLLEPCAGYKVGHIIAVCETDFNIYYDDFVKPELKPLPKP